MRFGQKAMEAITDVSTLTKTAKDYHEKCLRESELNKKLLLQHLPVCHHVPP